jgi:hypothetical protein
MMVIQEDARLAALYAANMVGANLMQVTNSTVTHKT